MRLVVITFCRLRSFSATIPIRGLRTGVIDRIPSLLAITFGLIVAHLFSPGIMNHDGLGILMQAKFGSINDWQPPFAIVFAGVLMSMGLKVAQMTALMAALTTLGIHEIATRLACLVNRRDRPLLIDRILGLVVLTILLTPFTALCWYLPYFGTDGWLATLFIYIGWLWLVASGTSNPWERNGYTLGLTALGILCVLIRPNTVVCLPVVAIMIALIQGMSRWRWIVFCWAGLMCGRPIILTGLYALVPITPAYPQDQVMALDLVGVAYERPDALAQMPFTASKLRGDDYRTRYQFGNVDLLFPWCGNPLTEKGYVQGSHAALAKEYRDIARKYPGTLAIVKFKAAAEYYLSQHSYWHNSSIDKGYDQLHLEHDKRYDKIRGLLSFVDTRIQNDPTLRFLLVRHLPWLLLCGVLLAAAACRRFATGDIMASRLGLLGLLPAVYYSSSAVASVAYQYRYMYPATLIVQIVAVTLAITWAYHRLTIRTLENSEESAITPPGRS